MLISNIVGKNPSQAKGTMVVIDLIEKKRDKFDPTKWGASLVKKEGNDITIQVLNYSLLSLSRDSY